MQIHELDNFIGDVDNAYAIVDDGTDTGKVTTETLLLGVNSEINAANERIDNLISGVTVDSEVIDGRVGEDGTTYSTIGTAIRSQAAELNSDSENISDRLTAVDKIIELSSFDFDIGTIYTGSYPWGYNYSAVRVRTKSGVTLPLKAGDQICLRDYTGHRFFVGWVDGNGVSGQSSWNTSDFTCKVDGDYVVVIGRITEATVTDITEYTSLLYVKQFAYDAINVTDRVDDLLTQTDFSNLLELGNIYASGGNPPSYSASSTRVRTLEGKLIPLKKGDKIYLTDNTTARMYVGWKKTDGTWTYFGYWITNPSVYKVTEDGDYWILITAVPEATVSDIRDLSGLLRIKRGTSYDDVSELIANNQRKNWFVRSINHRGYSRLYPENTLIAFKKSALLGWGAVETDVRYTSDDVPVLLHDQSINRTARNMDGTAIGTTVNIEDITYSQAQGYDFGIYKGPQFAGTEIPTFEQFVKLCRNLSLDMYIELKVANTGPLVNIVKACNMGDHATWISYSEGLLGSVLDDFPTARVGLLANSLDSTIVNNALALKTADNEVFVALLTSAIDSTAVNTLLANDLPLEAYTPNDDATIAALDPYVSGVTSDYIVAGRSLYEQNIE